MYRTFKNLAALLGLFLALMAPALAFARDTGRIKGRVTDEKTGDPLPAVTVTVTGPGLLGELTEFTDENGNYLITEVPPGEYLVRFYFADIVIERPAVQVNVNKTIVVAVAMPSDKAQAQTIQITERAPTIDVAHSQIQTVLTEELVKHMPIRGRTFEGVINQAPGASTDAVGPSFNGATGPENNYLINGANTTNVGYGLVGTQLSLEFVNETEVITGGFNAEFGRSTGGIVNLITKSGSNQLKGSVFFGVTPLQLDAKVIARSGEAVASQRYNRFKEFDIGFTLGGPIVKDRIWFFVGAHPQYWQQRYDRFNRRRLATTAEQAMAGGQQSSADPLASCPDYLKEQGDALCAPGGFITEDIAGTERTLKSHSWLFNYTGKLDFRIDDDNRFSVEYIASPSTFNGVFRNPREASATAGLGFNADPSIMVFDQTISTHDVIAHYTSKLLERKLQIDGFLGFHYQKFNEDPQARGNLVQDTNARSLYTFEGVAACQPVEVDGVMFNPCPVTNYAYGGYGFFQGITEQRFSLSLYLTYLLELAGTHQIKLGGDVEFNRYSNTRGYTGDVPEFYTIRSRDRGRRQFFARVTEGEDGTNIVTQVDSFSAESTSNREMLFLRDSYSPSFLPGLTLNAGVRWELEQVKGNDGQTAFSINDNVAPRIGAIYDFTQKGKSKIYANYGRFFEAIPLDIGDRAFSGESLVIQNAAGAGTCTGVDAQGRVDPNTCPFARPATEDNAFVLGGENTPVSPQLKGQYADEVVAGVEYDIGWDLVLGAAYMHRNLGRVIEDISVDGANTYFIANPGDKADPGVVRDLQNQINDVNAQLAMTQDMEQAASLQDRKDELSNQLLLVREAEKFPKPNRKHNAFILTARKRFSDSFVLLASYTYGRTIGNYPGLFDNSNGQLDPNISAQYDLAGLLLNRDGPLPNDRPHIFKLTGSYFLPINKERKHGVWFGASFNGESGIPIEVLGAHPIYGRLESFILPRGAGGRTPFLTSFDARISYALDWMEIGWEVYNVLNQRKAIAVDEEYTTDFVLPVVNGKVEDLGALKTVDGSDPRRNPNFGTPTAFQAPLAMRFSLRITF